MKKIILMAVSLCLLLSLTACSCGGCKSAPPTPEASYFLSDYKIDGVKIGLVEESVYELKYTDNGKQLSNGITPTSLEEIDKSYFKMTITTEPISSIDGGIENLEYDTAEYCYKLVTDYSLQGTYNYTELAEPLSFADKITSTIWFLGEKDNLKPIKAEKTVKCTTPYTRFNINNKSSIEFLNFDFSYTIDYSTKNAIIDYTDNLGNLEKEDKVIKNYFSNTFFENDLMYFYARTFKLSSGFSTTRQTITVDGKMDLSMKVAGFNKDYECKNLNGKTQNVKVDVVQYTNTGKFQSAPVSIYFANVSDLSLFRAPVRIEKFVTLVGQLEYNLIRFVHNEV